MLCFDEFCIVDNREYEPETSLRTSHRDKFDVEYQKSWRMSIRQVVGHGVDKLEDTMETNRRIYAVETS